MSMKFAVEILGWFFPRGPFSVQPKMVLVAKGPPCLLSRTSLGCRTWGVSLPISRPISASMLGNLIPFRCGQWFTCSCVLMVSAATGRLGREYTIGRPTVMLSLRSDTSKFRREHSIG